MNPHLSLNDTMPLLRRSMLKQSFAGVGTAALATMFSSTSSAEPFAYTGATTLPHFAPKAKRVISLFMHGGPSQIELLDDKPKLRDLHGTDMPESVRMGQRLTGMTANQKAFPLVSSPFRFQRHGESGAAFSELLPHLGTVADELCLVRSVTTEAINHDPAITFLQTGHQLPGRPSIGSWLSYGLGRENDNLPTYIVLLSRGSAARPDDPLYARLWGSGFLPSNHQGICFRPQGDPVLYLSHPGKLSHDARQRMLDRVVALNRHHHESTADPEILTRVSQYEMAFRMQSSVPELTEISGESLATLNRYGPDAERPGTFAANCLLARRMAERGVKFIQLFHRGWDQHYNLPSDIKLQARDVDQPCAALIADLKERGLLDDTLVIWGGEFGRTVYGQGKLESNNFGRDHHGRCFSIWMAGGGIKPGLTFGETDEYSYNIVKDPVHVHDLNATLLHCLGLDHTKLIYRFQGRDYRLTDVHGEVVSGVLR
ncbi:MAG: DUF1501 domain-containing protein [Planctomycetota bacterium]|nr:DUF1501 domain-containing protein [Planctomycetota bacterium]MDA1213825.1 DUF1501 domain-containing protein [Planctomycetota bacterium]